MRVKEFKDFLDTFDDNTEIMLTRFGNIVYNAYTGFYEPDFYVTEIGTDHLEVVDGKLQINAI